MARLGLGPRWRCVFSNDFSDKKAHSYRRNFPPAHELRCQDVASLSTCDLPGHPCLAWASFPCQDLSLAGERRGLEGTRSGTFWPFWNLMQGMASEGRGVPIIVLENVTGAITSNGGGDFRSLVHVLVEAGYRVGALVIDAAMFLPQSRPRLFVIAVQRDVAAPKRLHSASPTPWSHPKSLLDAYLALPETLQQEWRWWELPAPAVPPTRLATLIEEEPTGVEWDAPEKTDRLLALMSETNLDKVRQAQASGKRVIGTVYRRTRTNGNGQRIQRAEARFDQVAGCLRTPVGGSSRQRLLFVHGSSLRSRLLSPREVARLMGVPDSYQLPADYNETYHLMGDGLAVPVVSWLETHLLRPLGRSVNRLPAYATECIPRRPRPALRPLSDARPPIQGVSQPGDAERETVVRTTPGDPEKISPSELSIVKQSLYANASVLGASISHSAPSIAARNADYTA